MKGNRFTPYKYHSLKNADRNCNNKNPSETPLHTAVRNGLIETVQMLLREGANIDAKKSSGETSFHVATTGHNKTPLHLAVTYGNKEIITLLLSAKVLM